MKVMKDMKGFLFEEKCFMVFMAFMVISLSKIAA